MERFRTEVRHTKVEPKNYIALNRKKACSKNSSKPIPIPQTVKPSVGDKRISLLARRERHENTVHHSDVKRSLEQLASIISSGDLEKIIQLAKGIKSTTQVDNQPNRLSPQAELEDRVLPQPRVIPHVKVVEPSHISGLNLDNKNTHTRTTRLDAPILTEHYEKPDVTEQQHNIPAVITEPYFGRGQGLRQLLEVNNTRSSVIQHNVSKPTNEFKERGQEQEEEYYPWGRPGAGAPLTSFRGYDTTSLHDKSNDVDNSRISSQVQPPQQSFVRHNLSLIRNPDTRPEEDRRRKANQYMLELQAQVKEKERLKKEEEQKQIELDRIRNEKVAKERDQLLLESKREQERLNQKKHEANTRFQFLQAKIEEQHQMAIAERKKKKKYHHDKTPVQQTVLTTQPINTNDLITNKQSKLNKSNKQIEHKITKPSHKNIRNPPPSQLNVIQSHRVTDNKSSSMPTIRQSNVDHFEATKNYLAVSSECLEQSADVSVSCSIATSNDHVTSLHDLNTDVQHSDNSAQLQQIYLGEESVNLIKQLQKLKQGLHVKQQELHSTYF